MALDGTGRNSPYATALLKRIVEPDKSLTSVMIEVRNDVVSATAGQQVPWDHSALTGEFFFDPNAKPGDGAALKTRVKELENTLKTRTNAATEATLIQLRQRHAEMGEQNRRDWERVFELQRQKMSESDSMKLGSMVQEIGRLQIGVVRRGKDQAELKAQVERLEKELGAAPEVQAGATQAAPPAALPAPAPAAAPANLTAPAPVSSPAAAGTTPAATLPATGATPAAAPQTPAAPPAKRKKPQRSLDPNWATSPLGR